MEIYLQQLGLKHGFENNGLCSTLSMCHCIFYFFLIHTGELTRVTLVYFSRKCLRAFYFLQRFPPQQALISKYNARGRDTERKCFIPHGYAVCFLSHQKQCFSGENCYIVHHANLKTTVWLADELLSGLSLKNNKTNKNPHTKLHKDRKKNL